MARRILVYGVTIVALDYPRWFSLQRLVPRTLARAVLGTTICNRNRESLRIAFSRDSLLAWPFRTLVHKRRRVRRWMDQPDGPDVLRFTRGRQAEAWLSGLAPTGPRAP